MSGWLIDPFQPFEVPFMFRALLEIVLLAAVCGIVGVYVLLRRLAFLTDALTHTVFPGVVVGFLVAGEGGIMAGALVAGLASAAAFTAVSLHRRVAQDAALAIMLTAFFAVGVVLVSRLSGYTADLTAFLFGRLLTVDDGDITLTATAGALVLAVLAALHKELLLRAFDPTGARALGYRIGWLDLALNAVIALVVVAAVKAVGTLLVLALVIVPAAAARLISDRLAVMFALAAAFGALAGWIGLAASWTASVDYGVRLAAAGTVVLALVGIYLLAVAGTAARRMFAGGRRS
jgi:manganese/iron transport system permease protein